MLLLLLSVLLRLSLSMLLLRLGVLLRLLHLSMLLLLRLDMLLLLRLGLRPLLLLWSGASRNHRSDGFTRLDRPRRYHFRGTPVILGGKLRVVLCCCLLVL